ncbi:MAG: U32 family peptidase [Promethearchaeati archaeon]
MRISLACNWRMDLLHKLENEPESLKNLYDFYGTFDLSFTGTGRPFFLMAKRNKEEIEEFINKVHDLGLKFTWLWNGMCLGYHMFNQEEQTKALKELDWLSDLDVEYLTVADPYLAKFAKKYSPNLKLKVSVISEVNSLSRALEWEKIIGKEGVITLSIMLNRNFPLLKEIREKVDCDIELLTNDCCLNECPFRFFHYSECSHASQSYDKLEGYYNDWATIACQNQKVFKPRQIIMAKWIQPKDLDKYININIDYFKISGRRYGTAWLYRALKSYSNKSHKGNLGEIFNGYSFVSDPLELAGNQFSEFSLKQEKMGVDADNQSIMLSIPDFNAQLKAEALSDLIEKMPFKGEKCAENCGVTCFYCDTFIDRAYFIPSGKSNDSYRNYMKFLYDYLNKGEMFVPKEKRTLKPPTKETESDTYFGFKWTPEAEKFLEETMLIVPESMQLAAKKGIGMTAERTAEKKNLDYVDKDLIISITFQLVPQPFKHDFYDFCLEKGIVPQKYLNEDEIKSIKSLPYATDIIKKTAEERGRLVGRKQLEKKSKKKPKVIPNMNTKKEWEAYLTRFMKAYNELPDVESMLEPVAPLVFQYKISDRPEMNYWQKIEKNEMKWGMGEYEGEQTPTVIHKTNFDTIKKVNSGETNPIEATMAGTYVIEGDATKLMACAPLLPLNAKAHEKAIKM